VSPARRRRLARSAKTGGQRLRRRRRLPSLELTRLCGHLNTWGEVPDTLRAGDEESSGGGVDGGTLLMARPAMKLRGGLGSSR
jgi:hypothetical protein